jgi:hypothetical protein
VAQGQQLEVLDLQAAATAAARCRQRLQEDCELERRVIAEHAAWLEARSASDDSRRMAGARDNIKPYPPVELPERTINVTDPDSRNLKTPRGWVQGYNVKGALTPVAPAGVEGSGVMCFSFPSWPFELCSVCSSAADAAPTSGTLS